MTDRQKKMTAALAAVSAYVQQEEEAAAAVNMAVLPPPQTQAGTLNFWGPSGRLEMMSMRRLVQIRAFGRIR